MRSKRAFYVLLGATVLMVVAAVLSQRPVDDYQGAQGLHAPDLSNQAGSVQTVVIRSADYELRLVRVDDGWVARNRDDYPADAARVRAMVLGLSRLERLEKKTDNPDRLVLLELTGVDEPGSRAVEVTLLDDDDRTLAAVLVGKTEDFQSNGYSRYFVRDAGSPQAWLVRGTLPPVLDDPGNWLEQELMPGVGGAGFRSITVTHPEGQSIGVRRESVNRQDFELVGLADGEIVDSQYAVNQIPDTLERLSLKDVEVASVDDPEAVLTVNALTFNGVRITGRFQRLEPDYAVALQAAYEPGQDRRGDAERSGSDERDKRGGANHRSGDNGDEEHGTGNASADIDGQRLADELNRRWRGRRFIVSQYDLDALMVARRDLIKTADGDGGS